MLKQMEVFCCLNFPQKVFIIKKEGQASNKMSYLSSNIENCNRLW